MVRKLHFTPTQDLRRCTHMSERVSEKEEPKDQPQPQPAPTPPTHGRVRPSVPGKEGLSRRVRVRICARRRSASSSRLSVPRVVGWRSVCWLEDSSRTPWCGVMLGRGGGGGSDPVVQSSRGPPSSVCEWASTLPPRPGAARFSAHHQHHEHFYHGHHRLYYSSLLNSVAMARCFQEFGVSRTRVTAELDPTVPLCSACNQVLK